MAKYEAAIAEIERLWDAEPGTADGDGPDTLAALVERYESELWPIDTSRVDLGEISCTKPEEAHR